jgi:hypothetical protein
MERRRHCSSPLPGPAGCWSAPSFPRPTRRPSPRYCICVVSNCGRVSPPSFEVESGINDPISVLLAVLLVDLLLASVPLAGSDIAALVAREVVGGVGFGIGGGYLLLALINRLEATCGLYRHHGARRCYRPLRRRPTAGASGFLAVYLAGLVLGQSLACRHPSWRQRQAPCRAIFGNGPTGSIAATCPTGWTANSFGAPSKCATITYDQLKTGGRLPRRLCNLL